MGSQSFDPSQQQPYQYDYHQQQPHQFNQSAYYQYQTQYYPQPSYPYYANQHLQDSSIYPPGVPIPDPNASISSHDLQNHHNGYYYNYPNAGISATPLSSEGYAQPSQVIQASNAVVNGTGHNASNVSGQGHFSSAHGQEHATAFTQAAAPIPVPASHQLMQPSYGSTPGISSKRVKPNVKPKGRKMKSQQPCQPAYCELCKVDCNSLEIFEQHKNGKKHQKNLKAHNGLQTLNKVVVEEQKPEIQSQIEVKIGEQTAIEAGGSEESAAMKRKKMSLESQGNGLKLKKKNGKGAKRLKSDDGSKRPVEPVKPKVVPLVCELCNVKCESPMVFQAHLTGKKHLANIKRFHGEQAIVGQAAVEALYPALQVWYPALQALFKGDMTTLISELQQQGYLDAQGQPVPPTATALSELPQQQPDLPPEGGSGTATSSQVVAVTEGKTDATSSQVVAVTEGKDDEHTPPVPVATTNAENEILEGK